MLMGQDPQLPSSNDSDNYTTDMLCWNINV